MVVRGAKHEEKRSDEETEEAEDGNGEKWDNSAVGENKYTV